jgi:hypothetical protein
MGLSDRLKDLRSKAEDAVVDRKDQIQQTVQKVGEAADQRTGGKYHEKIQKAGEKATGFVEGLGEEGTPAAAPSETAAEGEPPPAA